jgi:hypothetical protein
MFMNSSAERRYVVRLAIATAAYIFTLWLGERFVGSGAVVGLPAYLLALLPGLSVTGMFWAVARLMIEETDEYLRMLLVRQSLIATGFTLSLVTIWGFLENFNLVPHVDAFYVAILWFFGLGIGSVANKFMFQNKNKTS